mmetsp:Transcript_29566/g.91412  ORF Transcript_29566/g.91412 Transcript_29566/m.91412 type:complete len:721 (+) Transcript_29566:50-2212(+)
MTARTHTRARGTSVRLVAVAALISRANPFQHSSARVRRPPTRADAILTVGTPLEWADATDRLAYVREHGVDQFIAMWQRSQKLERNDDLVWGDEIEYAVLKVEEERARCVLRGPEIRDELAAKEDDHAYRVEGCAWHPEYGRWMIEGTPRRPYSGYAADLCRVERNMRLRRRRLLSALRPDEICPTLVNFPHFGVGDFACFGDGSSPGAPGGPIARSASVPDDVIHPHPRFATLTANIRERRGETVRATPPRFFDEKTPADANPHVEGVDAMAYGMGACCLQVTFQARDATEARYCYDQLAALAPVMLALTAASPCWRGVLAETDARWDVIAASVDDRRPAEDGRGSSEPDERLAGAGVRPLPRSRYGSISRYAFACATGEKQVERFCDVDAPLDEAALAKLKAAGVDDALARHVAHLFVRDPLVIFEGLVEELDDSTATDHFDNLQSTNWNTVRLKPPVGLGVGGVGSDPSLREPGWRAEFRPMEVQLTDFENAAFAVFSVLVTRVVLAFDLSLYVPLSRVDANMRRAQRRDAATTERFYFRRQLAPDSDEAPSKFDNCCGGSDDDVFEEMTCQEIIDGKGDYFPGLAPLAYAYLDHIGCDPDTFKRVSAYIELVRKKASGEALTGAAWIRNFVTAHPDYKKDSVVSAKVARDLAVAAHEVGIGERPAPELTGGVAVRPVSPDGAWDVRLKPDKIPTADERRELLARYARRGAFQEGTV